LFYNINHGRYNVAMFRFVFNTLSLTLIQYSMHRQVIEHQVIGSSFNGTCHRTNTNRIF